MKREAKEETQIDLEDATYIDKLYVRYSDLDFIYHMFHKRFDILPQVTIQPKEHKKYKRIEPRKALALNLIEDLDECIKLFYGSDR